MGLFDLLEQWARTGQSKRFVYMFIYVFGLYIYISIYRSNITLDSRDNSDTWMDE